MSGTVWTKFYWADWMSDAGVRRSSLAARGLWIDMLCIAAQADPIGYLTVKKVPLTVKDIARMVGESEPETGTLLDELERNGVFSRDRNGTIFSRRIVRDEKKARTAQNNGKKGGNPSLGNSSGKSASDNLPDKGALKPHIPESSYQEREKQEARAGALIRSIPHEPDGWPADYREIFWASYPHKVGKADALAKLDRVRKRGIQWNKILIGLAAYIQTKPPDRPWCNPATWLHQERWEDQPRNVVQMRRAPDV